MASADTSWIREGGEAAVSYGGLDPKVTLVEIARVTKTQIILVDDRRFRRDGNHSQVGSRNGANLQDPRSRHIVAKLARQALRTYAYEVSRLVSGSTATVQNMTALDVEAAMDDLHTKLQDARKEIVRRARSAEAAGVDLR